MFENLMDTIGFVAAADPEVGNAMQKELELSGAVSGNVFSTAATRAAYTHCDDWRAGMLDYLDGNRALLREQLNALLPDAARLKAVGIGVSGRVEPSRGTVVRSEALNWTDVNLSGAFERAFGLPARIENDVKSCLTWERVYRALPDELDVAYLYIGRAGIGFANTSNSAIVRGKSSGAGEIENLQLLPGDGLDRHLMEKSMVSRAQKVDATVRTLQDILTAYNMELPWARLLLKDFSDSLGMLVRLIQGLLDPHLIILGGDVPEAFAGVPGLLPGDRYCIGERFEESCAYGAAIIAMREAVHRMISDMLEP